MNNNILIVVIVAALLYVMSAGTGNAATTTAQNGQGCLQAIQAQYSSQWADMNQVQRAMVGLRAASCEEGR
jgi:hypothetical protein